MLPLLPPPLRPAPAVTPVMVPSPVPGNVCPGAKVIRPLLAMCSPVSAGMFGAVANSRFNVADGDAVLFPTGSANQWNTWLAATLVPLLKVEATRPRPFELLPAEAVAVDAAGKLSSPRTVVEPFTSRVAAGVEVPMPILAVLPLPVCSTTESMMVEAPLKDGRKFALPPVVVTSVAVDGETLPPPALVAETAGPELTDGAASTNAEAGSPPRVCASAAFRA